MNTITNQKIFYYKTTTPIAEKQRSANLFSLNNAPDTFERQSKSPTFTSLNAEMAILRKYARDLGDAYGGNMLTAETYEYIMKKVKTLGSDASIARFIQKYSTQMDPYERKILNFYATKLKEKPSSTFESVTQEQLKTSTSKLQPIYLKTVASLETIAEELPNNKVAKRLKTIIEEWKQALSNGNYEDAMISAKYQYMLEKIKFPKQHHDIKTKILTELNNLPNANDNFDAFIIKYGKSNKRVILKRLLHPFRVSIEHLDAKANGGHANAIGNCVLVKTRENNDRGNADIIKGHPERKQTLKNYFRNVVDKINNGGMKGIRFYPFELKKSIEKVSNHTINLDKEIARLKISEEEAYKDIII